MKKYLVLVVLFLLPIVTYLFFATGVNNFIKLPVLTENVQDVNQFKGLSGETISFKNKITILGFLGYDINTKKAAAFNLNQKIYKRFFEFNDFQFVMLIPEKSKQEALAIKQELSQLTNTNKWHFLIASDSEIKSVFNSLNTNLSLNESLSTPYVFIIDKEGNLRGRKNDEDAGLLYGFNANSVAEINNKMVDDVKVILAEYRLALKKNNAYRNK